MDRRQFLKTTAGGMALMAAPFGWAAPTGRSPDHFFLLVALQGGLDHSYFFDARPLALTQAGLIQNYLGMEPLLMQDSAGQSCWRSILTEPLRPYFGDLSIINGVMTMTGFDGHDQAANILFTGNPFGGDGFIPHLNRPGAGPAILDGLQYGQLLGQFTNADRIVSLDSQSGMKLQSSIQAFPPIALSSPVLRFVRDRLVEVGTGVGGISAGARQMAQGLQDLPALDQSLRTLAAGDGGAPPEVEALKVATDLFKKGVALAAILAPNFGLDTHAAKDAKRAQMRFSRVMDYLVNVFKFLKNTPFDGKRSYWDVTTVVVTSEFGRTMRQKNARIDDTGTDHNSFSNSAILGGKGIRGGLILGASDMAGVGEPVSGAHLSLDRDLIKTMGRPFDFARMRPRTDLPPVYDPGDYLTVHSLINTIYACMEVPENQLRKVAQSGVPYPILHPILKT
jgi:hypothetical protein